MTAWLGAGFVAATWALLAERFGLVGRCRHAVALAGESVRVLRDPALTDDHKERELQRYGAQLLLDSLRILAVSLLALGGPVAIVGLLSWAGIVSVEAVTQAALSPAFLVAASALGCGFWWLQSRATVVPTAGKYSSLERTIHHLAFRTVPAQLAAADVEDLLWRGSLADVRSPSPVFIAGLPRAGTTILLQALAELPQFAAHRYRDMPFVLTPCLWDRFSRRYRRHIDPHERAHGDGMLISEETAEALEEVVWKRFWPRQYDQDRIRPWPTSSTGWGDDSEFAHFFRQHRKKVVLLRRQGDETVRYASKNNLNIARVPYLRCLCRDAKILVPFRDPVQQAASLLTQHRRFLKLHAEDAFASQYMLALGHFDFGANLRPIDFDGWLDRDDGPGDACSLPFWLRYWVATYSHLLEVGPAAGAHFVAYDSLCRCPAESLGKLAVVLSCPESSLESTLPEQATLFSSPSVRDVDLSGIAPRELDAAHDLHARLLAAAVC